MLIQLTEDNLELQVSNLAQELDNDFDEMQVIQYPLVGDSDRRLLCVIPKRGDMSVYQQTKVKDTDNQYVFNFAYDVLGDEHQPGEFILLDTYHVYSTKQDGDIQDGYQLAQLIKSALMDASTKLQLHTKGLTNYKVNIRLWDGQESVVQVQAHSEEEALYYINDFTVQWVKEDAIWMD